MPYVPDADDIYEIAFLVSRGWVKHYDNWYKRGMKQEYKSEHAIPEKKYTKAFSQKEAFETESDGEFVDDDDSLINKVIQEPLDSDFDTMESLISDLKEFAKNNTEHRFICCDYVMKPKGPRFAWIAFIDRFKDQQIKVWSITIENAAKSKSNLLNVDPPINRQKMLNLAVNHARGIETPIEAPQQYNETIDVQVI